MSQAGQELQQEEGVTGEGRAEGGLAGRARARAELETDVHGVHQAFVDGLVEQEDAGLDLGQELVVVQLHVLETGGFTQPQLQTADLRVQDICHQIILEIVHQEDHVLSGLSHDIYIITRSDQCIIILIISLINNRSSGISVSKHVICPEIVEGRLSSSDQEQE